MRKQQPSIVNKLEVVQLTQPEFSSFITKSILVLFPILVEIHLAAIAPLDHLKCSNKVRQIYRIVMLQYYLFDLD